MLSKAISWVQIRISNFIGARCLNYCILHQTNSCLISVGFCISSVFILRTIFSSAEHEVVMVVYMHFSSCSHWIFNDLSPDNMIFHIRVLSLPVERSFGYSTDIGYSNIQCPIYQLKGRLDIGHSNIQSTF